MGTQKEYSVNDVANFNKALAEIGANEALESKVIYRLGRFCDQTERIVKRIQAVQQQKLAAFRERIGKLTDQEKAIENDKLQAEFREMGEQMETLFVPELNYSDFTCKSDKKVGDREYKSGDTLVPMKFFALMGDIIKDDQKLVSGIEKVKEVKMKANTK